MFRLGISLSLNAQLLSGVNPFASLMSTLLSGASQLIAHPLEYGSMFQDRAGTIPVTAQGQLVGHVLDAGGGGYHATAISDAARGVFREVDGIRYIEYNGVNTAYATPALPAPLVDKAQVFAGVRKLSDSNTGTVIELSNTASFGSLGLFAPFGGGANNYNFRSHGGANVNNIVAGFDAPITNVLTGIGDISGDINTLRINGDATTVTTDQGTFNYNPSGIYPLYYGARAGISSFFNGRSYATLGPITRFSATNATTEQIEAAEAYYTARVI